MSTRSTGGSAVPLVWVDCEMTGLQVGTDALVEVACLVTDANLNPLDDGHSVVIRPRQEALDQMSELVTGMHRASGLLPLITSGVPAAEAEDQVMAYLRGHVPEVRKAPLAGSSVYVDRGFLAVEMPAFEGHLHYRVVDVSSIKELVKRWYPKVFFTAPEKTGNHRALGDVLDSIAELRYYRDAVFVGRGSAGAAPLAPEGAATL